MGLSRRLLEHPILTTWQLAGFPQSKQSKRQRWKLQCLLWTRLGSYTLLLLQYSIGLIGQARCRMEGDYKRAEIQKERVIRIHLGGWLPHYHHPHLGYCDHFSTESPRFCLPEVYSPHIVTSNPLTSCHVSPLFKTLYVSYSHVKAMTPRPYIIWPPLLFWLIFYLSLFTHSLLTHSPPAQILHLKCTSRLFPRDHCTGSFLCLGCFPPR